MSSQLHKGEPSKRSSIDDHRQTLSSAVVEEQDSLQRRKSDSASRPRDLLQVQVEKSGSTTRKIRKARDQLFLSQSYPYCESEALSSQRRHGPSSNDQIFRNGQQIDEKANRAARPTRPGKVGSSKKSAGSISSNSNSSRSITPTGAPKPPLKPHRSRHSRSVSTRSTGSATYVSSDSSEGGENDDDSIEAPEIHMRVYDGKVPSLQEFSSSSWTSSSSLAPYDSADDGSRRFAMVPFREKDNRDHKDSKEKKLKNSRTVSSKKQSSLPTSTSDDEDVDPFYQLGSMAFPTDDDNGFGYNLSSSDDSESVTNEAIVDLDQMIAETSARWKSTVSAIVSSTVTASKAAVNPVAVPLLSSQLTSLTTSVQQSARNDQLITLGKPIVTNRHCMGPSLLSIGSDVIEQQQAEIEALRAALKAQQQAPRSYHTNQYFLEPYSKVESTMLVLPETTEFHAPHANFGVRVLPRQDQDEGITIDCAPVEQIEVNHDTSDPNSSQYWHDDLTVWSGFNTVTGGMESVQSQPQNKKPDPSDNSKVRPRSVKPEIGKRPDAESATGASALNGVPTRVVEDMKVELSSGLTGITRKAVYSGTINAHTRLPEGQGIFKFTETGDIYQGEVHAGEMHGAGTYKFGKTSSKKTGKSKSRPKELKGTFEHNVYIG